MARSKLVNLNRAIAEGAVRIFGKMEESVVGGYMRIEDAFVDRWLTREGETVEEAKRRLREHR